MLCLSYRRILITTGSGPCLPTRFSRELDLFRIIGNQTKVDEILGILLVIELNKFDGLYPTWLAWGEKGDESFPSRMSLEADWMYYDPVSGRASGDDVVRFLAANLRHPIPHGHLVVFNFDMALDG